jgi:hypothetical protein
MSENLRMSKVILFILCLSGTIQAQRIIEIDFSHSLRIPDHNVRISIWEQSSTCSISVVTRPANDNKRWEQTHKSYRTSFSKELFENLYLQLLQLNVDEIIANNATVRGLDGTDCKLRFGDLQNIDSIDIWSPDYDTKKRRLVLFLQVYSKIIEVSGLNPKKILD